MKIVIPIVTGPKSVSIAILASLGKIVNLILLTIGSDGEMGSYGVGRSSAPSLVRGIIEHS